MRPQFLELKTHCVVCTAPVPPERLKYKAITCSDEHARIRKLSMRAKQDSRECRFCRKPATPAEKASYQRFRKWEARFPELAYPAQFKRWENTPEEVDRDIDFTLATAQRMAQEDEDAAERAETEAAAATAAQVQMEPICTAGSSL
jgi:predicted nucleic acid-binding Zn ribbon protein